MNPVGTRDHLERARTLYDARRYDVAATSALDAIADDPNDANAHVILSLAYDRLGKLKEAEAAARRAIALDPERANAHVAFGIVRLSQRRYPDALRAFREAIALDAYSDDAYRLAAIAQMNQNHDHDALVLIVKALDLDPDVIATREVHAMILLRLGRAADAEAETAELLRMHPESILGLSQEGSLHLRRGDYAKARATYREALRLDPNSETARSGYERVVIKSAPYADWCGRQLFFVALFLFFSAGPVSGISTDLGAAAFFTAAIVLVVNRPIAVEALRRDEVGRTFLTPEVLARNRTLLVYAGAAEASLIAVATLHRHATFGLTFGFFGAALATERAMRASLTSRVRTIYARLAHAIAVLGALLAGTFATARALDPRGTRDDLVLACSIAFVASCAAMIVFFALDAVFVIPGIFRRFFARVRRR